MKETVVKALIRDANDNVLVLYRSMTHPKYAGHADLPGGEVEDGEENVAALIREISEETGLNVAAENLEKLFEKENGMEDGVTYIDVLYALNVDKISADEIQLSWEHMSCEVMGFGDFLQMGLPDGVDPYFRNVWEWLNDGNS